MKFYSLSFLLSLAFSINFIIANPLLPEHFQPGDFKKKLIKELLEKTQADRPAKKKAQTKRKTK